MMRGRQARRCSVYRQSGYVTVTLRLRLDPPELLEGLDTGRLRFSEIERITVPFHSDDDPTLIPAYPCDDLCMVYDRVTVAGNFELEEGSGVFLPAIVVYYDSLHPDVALVGGEPVPFDWPR